MSPLDSDSDISDISDIEEPLTTLFIGTPKRDLHSLKTWQGRDVDLDISASAISIDTVFKSKSSSFDLEEELPAIRALPNVVCSIIGNFLFSDFIIDSVRKQTEVDPDLKIHANNATYLNLGHIKMSLTDTLSVLKYYSNLEHLTMPKSFLCSTTKTPHALLLEIIDLISKLETLHSLDLSTWTDSSDKETLITDNLLQRLSSKSLHKLNVAGSEKITDDGVSYITTYSNLTSINLSKCNLSDNSLIKISKLTKLTHLDISLNLLITDPGIKNIAKLDNLKYINLSELSGVTDKGIKYICGGCKNLEHIELSGHYGVTNASLKELSALPNLRIIIIHDCFSINGHGLKYLSINVEHLDLFGCGKINENDLATISNLSKLVYLNIGHITNISDESFLYLHSLRNLTNLTVSKTLINSSGLSLIMMIFPQLVVEYVEPE